MAAKKQTAQAFSRSPRGEAGSRKNPQFQFNCISGQAMQFSAMRAIKDSPATIVLFCLLTIGVCARAAADDSRLFAFKFQTNQPLVYAVSLKFRTVTENNVGGKTTMLSNTRDIRYRARLTEYRMNPDGTTLVHFKPYHLAEDLDNTGQGHSVAQIRDLKIKSLQNGIVTIDTENNVGMGQANSIRINVYPNLLSGYFNFAPSGRTLTFEGDLPFVDYWTGMLKGRLGFFYLYFPDHPVGIHETWTETILNSSSGGVTLDNPLTFTNTFTREPDLTTNGNPVATFDMTGGDHLQNISGYSEQNGQKSSLNISQMDRNTFGTYQFDQKR